ncbi:MAG: AMP-binding protein [Corynebacterium sp.]|nr:AMP-binding protein [Corynebacterium sp.]
MTHSYPAAWFPQASQSTYAEAGYWVDETFATWFDNRVVNFGEQNAVVGRSARGTAWSLSYRELQSYAQQIAAHLQQAGLSPGDRAIVHFPNTIEFAGAVLGCFYAGVVPIFSVLAHAERDLAYFVHNAHAAAVLTVERFGLTDFRTRFTRIQEQGAALAAAGEFGETPDITAFDATRGVFDVPKVQHIIIPAPDGLDTTAVYKPVAGNSHDVAFMQLSGGTTGVPKLIARSHVEYLYSVRASATICELDTRSKMLAVMPAAHNFTMSSPGILGVWHAGGAVYLHADPTPSSAFSLIAKEGITFAPLVPPLLLSWLDAATKNLEKVRTQLATLRFVQVGGAKLLPEVARRVAPELGVAVQQVFGMAEGLVCYTSLGDNEEHCTETQGRPLSPADEIRILDELGNPVAPNTPGNLWTQGPYTIRGYVNGVDAASFSDDGFYCTGDIVRQRRDGYLVVEGRAKDQINRAGEKIAPDEVENVLLSFPGIRDAVVIGLPDSKLGERSCAVLLGNPGDPHYGDTTGVRTRLRAAGLSAYKIPDDVVWQESLPATAVGKISRKELRRRLAQHLQAG